MNGTDEGNNTDSRSAIHQRRPHATHHTMEHVQYTHNQPWPALSRGPADMDQILSELGETA